MERGPATLPPSVIEGVLDFTTVYYITTVTTETRITDRSSTASHVSSAQKESPPKSRPVATVRPFPVTKEEAEQEGQASSDSKLLQSLEKEPTFYKNPEKGGEILSNENIEKDNSDGSEDCGTVIKFDPLLESLDEERVFPSPSQELEASSSLPSPQPPSTLIQSTPKARETRDPCRHRDKLRAVFATMMEVYQNGGECHNGQGCAGDVGEGNLKETRYKETCLTECLDEFLEELQLTHLRDYLRVLGCTCVRDLKLLEEPELNAIQLVSRRRLLKRLESMSLHHEAPPSDCSLEGWLTWYGLTHISGFLNAIGVLTVADMSYLKEEDLELLKPVTRRRILSLYRK